jgi:hypothetical protein
MNRIDGDVVGLRLPPLKKISQQLHGEQAVRAGVFKEVVGRSMQVVDLAPVLQKKFEEGVANGAIREPDGEGEFEVVMLISNWSDGGSKSLKGFYAETTGFIDDQRGLITREKAKLGARSHVLERVLVVLALGKESQEMVQAAQAEIGEQFKQLGKGIGVGIKGRKGRLIVQPAVGRSDRKNAQLRIGN